MDTTPGYIEMCKMALELQDEWKPKAWDYLFCLSAKYPKFSTGPKGTGNITVLSGDDAGNGYHGHGLEERAGNMVYFCDNLPNQPFPLIASFKKYHLFLPRQAQLQEMIGEYRLQSQLLCAYFQAMVDWKTYLGQERDYWDQFNSMEQLWLAFVMIEKFSKTWNAEKKEWEN